MTEQPPQQAGPVPPPPRPVRSLAAAGLALVALLVFAGDCLWGFWDRDAGFFLSQSDMILAGLRPYRDFQPFYPPLVAALHAGPLALWPDRLSLFVLLPLAWVLAVGIATAACWRPRPAGRAPLLAAGIGGYALYATEYGGNHITLEHGVVGFTLAAVWAWARGGRWRFAWVGLWCGCAFLCKQVGLLMFLPFLLQVRRAADAASLVAGGALPLLAVAGWAGVAPSTVLGGLRAAATYVARRDADLDVGLAWQMRGLVLLIPSLLKAELTRAWLGAAAGLTLAALGLVGLARHLRAGERAEALWLGSWLTLGAIHASAYAVNAFPHYLLNVWPTAVVVLGSVERATVGRATRRWLPLATAATAGAVLFTGGSQALLGAYTARWSAESPLTGYVAGLANAVLRSTPEDAQIFDYFSERAVLVVAGRAVMERDWRTPWASVDTAWVLAQLRQARRQGPAYLLVNLRARGGQADWTAEEALRQGLVPAGAWSSAWGDFRLYRVP